MSKADELIRKFLNAWFYGEKDDINPIVREFEVYIINLDEQPYIDKAKNKLQELMKERK